MKNEFGPSLFNIHSCKSNNLKKKVASFKYKFMSKVTITTSLKDYFMQKMLLNNVNVLTKLFY